MRVGRHCHNVDFGMITKNDAGQAKNVITA